MIFRMEISDGRKEAEGAALSEKTELKLAEFSDDSW